MRTVVRSATPGLQANGAGALTKAGFKSGRLIVSTLAVLWLATACQPGEYDKTDHPVRTSEAFGLRFHYPADLYLARFERDQGESPRLSIVLVEDLPINVAYVHGRATELMEGPPMITIDVYENPDALAVDDWFRDRTNWASRAFDVRTGVAGSREYLEYRWDGLYAGRSVVFSSNAYVYVLSVTWLDASDRLPAVFDRLLDSRDPASP
ncbi:MAG: hypothetical protein OEY08_12295 [Gammaproteobacteria bacterium]|nr:hypothetical protein [Gammaproteobacteria bacterium]